MRILHSFAAAVLAAFVLAGCSGSAPGPNEDQLKSSIREELDNAWQVTSLDIESRAQEGTETSPVVTTRFTAEIESTEPLFVQVRPREAIPNDLLGWPYTPQAAYIRRVQDKGLEIKIAGTTRSARHGEGWQTRVALETASQDVKGAPRSKFEGMGFPVVETDSDEAKEWISKIRGQIEAQELAAKEKAERVAAARAAEAALQEERRKAWAENQNKAFTALAFEPLSGRTYGVPEYRLQTNLKQDGDSKVSGTIEWTAMKGNHKTLKWRATKVVEGTLSTNAEGLLVLNLEEKSLVGTPEGDAREVVVGLVYELKLDPKNPNQVTGQWGAQGTRQRSLILGKAAG
jgi:hypothetical protein